MPIIVPRADFNSPIYVDPSGVYAVLYDSQIVDKGDVHPTNAAFGSLVTPRINVEGWPFVGCFLWAQTAGGADTCRQVILLFYPPVSPFPAGAPGVFVSATVFGSAVGVWRSVHTDTGWPARCTVGTIAVRAQSTVNTDLAIRAVIVGRREERI